MKVVAAKGHTVDDENGKQAEITAPVIELPVTTVVANMIQTGQPTTNINGVILQNGLTTTQVSIFMFCNY